MVSNAKQIKQLKQLIESDPIYSKRDRNFGIILGGMFPSKIPPCFSSKSFNSCACINFTELLGKIDEENVVTNYMRYYLARHNKICRVLGFVNPIVYLLMSSFFYINHQNILEKADSRFSLSSPKLINVIDELYNKSQDDDEDSDDISKADHNGSVYKKYRSVKQKVDWKDNDLKKLENRAGKQFILKTDISRFYPSIYTHIIPWVMEGKDAAKNNRADLTKNGNILDKLFQWMQDGQTFGIPIGPDISYVVSEVIMSEIDKEIDEKIKSENIIDYSWIRRIDDYEFSCNSMEDANNILSIVQFVLNKYELELNTHKTEILKLPIPIVDREIQSMCEIISKINEKFKTDEAKLSKREIMNYFNISFEAFNNGIKGALKYSINAINNDLLGCEKFREIFINFICQCMIAEEGTSEVALIKISSLLKKDTIDEKDKNKVKDTLYAIIRKHYRRKHTSEVVWALWGLFLFKENISSEINALLCKMEDPIVYIMLLYLVSKDLADKDSSEKAVEEYLKKDKLKYSSKNWMLIYEVSLNGWLSSDFIKNIEKNKFFDYLKEKDISFFIKEDDENDYLEMFEELDNEFY